MKLPMTFLFTVLLAAGAQAEELDGFLHWSASDLAQQDKDLNAKVKNGFSTTGLGKFGNHAAAITHREQDGGGEIHEKKHDFFFVQSGKATLITGGTLIDDTPKANGEHTGAAIKDGKETPLGPGDIMHIPAGMPHQLKIKPGDKFTYFVIKVDTVEAKVTAAPDSVAGAPKVEAGIKVQ
jgi:mannose-6-phosphate isomerase-like protein (cupin superfamily)